MIGIGSVQAMTFHAAAHRSCGTSGRASSATPVLAAARYEVRGRRTVRVATGPVTSQHRRRARPRRRNRVGQGIFDHPGGIPRHRRTAGRDIPLDAGKVADVYAGYETLKSRRDGVVLLDFDDLLLHTAAAIENDARSAQEFRRPLPLLRRRRVPGRHTAAAAGAHRLAGRARRSDRRRRRQPDHLLVHRGHTALPARFLAAVPRRRPWCGWNATTGPHRRWCRWPTG